MIGDLTKSQQNRRTKIIRTATSSFAKVGFYETDMEEIAKTAGVGKGTLYRYFQNKEALYLQCVEDTFRKFFDYILVRTKETNSAESFIKELIRAMINFFRENREIFDLIIRSSTSHFESSVAKLDEVKMIYYRDFREKLNNAALRKKMNTDILIMAVETSVTYLIYRKLNKNEFSFESIENDLTKLFLYGIAG